MEVKNNYKIIIVGGGTAGICVAARLKNIDSTLDIAIIEPSKKHYYQPLWTLVGGGVFKKEETERNEVDYIPDGVTWIQESVDKFLPEDNKILIQNGKELTYEYLVVATGMELYWDKIKGLKENIGKNGVCSNYSYNTVDSTWNVVEHFKGGNAIFTQPSTPIKCGGAPQKALYLTEDYFRTKSKVRDKTKMIFFSGLAGIFGVDKYKKALEKVVKRKEIDARFRYDLIEIIGEKKEAVFKNLDTQEEVKMNYDMLHVVPPMGTHSFIKNSTLVDSAGFVEVDKFNMQHVRYANIFSLGDCSSLPTARTGAAIRKQAPVLVDKLMSLIENRSSSLEYDGYSSCPLVTGYGSLILAEFNYLSQPTESFPFDQSKERFSMYMLKAYALPQMYWNGMLRGKM
ncbi:MAG: FAD/NAD(P)-binding oxidoreductase [Cyanobacteriota bacterium]